MRDSLIDVPSDWFRLETKDDSFQPTIDMLLNVSIFAFYGAVCPWYEFAYNDSIPIYRLIFLGIMVLLFRRLPFILAIYKRIPQIEDIRQALFVGFFGPIGVSAVFYLYTTLDYLRSIEVDGVQREDARRLSGTIYVVVWFLAICSIVVHGLSVPLGKLGLYIPRAASRALSERSGDGTDAAPFRVAERSSSNDIALRGVQSKAGKPFSKGDSGVQPGQIYRIGGSIIKDQPPPSSSNLDVGTGPNSSSPGSEPTDPHSPAPHEGKQDIDLEAAVVAPTSQQPSSRDAISPAEQRRAIKFSDQ